MQTKAMRLYGADDIRLEEFTLPPVGVDEVLIKVVCDAICTSTYKAVRQGTKHKRVPPNVAEKIIREFYGLPTAGTEKQDVPTREDVAAAVLDLDALLGL